MAQKAVSFKMPEDRYTVLQAVARERGTDVSAVLNTIISDALPALRNWLAQRLRDTDPLQDELVQTMLLLRDMRAGAVPADPRAEGELYRRLKQLEARHIGEAGAGKGKKEKKS
jgi:hypothetical protein